MDWESATITDADLEFLVETAAPEVTDKVRLRKLIKLDEDLRNGFIEDENTSQKIMTDQEVFLKISPRLYFEILLRKTRRELEGASHTIEKSGSKKIAVFDTKEVVDLLSRQEILVYLADMLASFIKVENYTLFFRTEEAMWQEIRFSDLDIDSLIIFSESVDEEARLGFFKRIGDICLFILGLFPEYVQATHHYPFSGELKPQVIGRGRRSLEDYEEEGRRFYQLAAQHPAARSVELSRVFNLLHEKFNTAKKPLNFIAHHYLNYRRLGLVGGKS
ncbi:MAG: hypothetical protein P8075_02830 [Deltaproteobacteria bacterium]|jgi:hypothetical protein